MKIRTALPALALLALTACGAQIDAYQSPDTNQVSYWCALGFKYEPVSTPFVVPAPPAGYTWTLLVLKAGSGPGENETFANPVVGQAYSRSDGKSISHAILCKSINTTTTSTSTSTTSMPTTTTSMPTTTTTCPDCGINTVVITPPPPPSTTTPVPNTFGVPGTSTTTSVAASTTVPGATTTTTTTVPTGVPPTAPPSLTIPATR